MQSTKRYLPLYLFLLLFGGVLLASCKNSSDVQARPEDRITNNKSDDSPASAKPSERPVILAFGDSLTAGYGLESSRSYPSLLQKRLDERGYNYKVVNAGISGDTTAGGLRRIDQ
ncbi:MAG TPA: GDSL-type esterase/lipase family protein, partial [Blastocatellia bacterium]|nr:GDSL-type esterase/lipase family protein [Blastocatellia bacterium]